MVKRNSFIAYSALAAAVMTGLVFMASLAKTAQKEGETEAESVVVETSNSSMTTLGAIGDTPEDTLRTLTASLTQNQKDKKKMDADLERTQASLDAQKSDNAAQIEAMSQRFNQQLELIEQKLASNLSNLKERQQDVAVSAPELEQLGIASGREDRLDDGSQQVTPSNTTTSSSTLIWIDPLDAKKDDTDHWITPLMQSGTTQATTMSEMEVPFDTNVTQSTPIYTLHRGAVLSNATSLTALMGRIPVNGQVTSPYPFSMVIGAKNLLANGFTLPEVQGAIVTGTVTGDWSLSCVRGAVESIDFIRTDGTILSYPEVEGAITSDFDGSRVQTQDLGYLADQNGNPCLSGIRISNAPQYLTTKGLLDAATAAAKAAATAQQTISVDGGTSTSALTGSAMKNAAGESAAALTGTVSDFIQSRMGSSFDIIYVEPGIKAAIHLRQPITLSVPEVPYRVRYQTSSQGASYALP
ncbi:TIGR03752 family integrating conjugative element protein [Vibrio sinensis]|uniref:TIGR03752 family integrating conjugative element protein n=1 Tax=Vibrio sinensis TaxID=2302434 RepID=A0A3A6Q9V6_9VIBR|nr:TIGR03752 family integrating conjugative element protein [Vibrio sinensis]RJX68674.1 TIGR03752 family integrating conjugative element protein [Vibrio sinensis]